MATLINRQMFWAVNGKVLPCVILAHDLTTATLTVLLENGARHDADAYDVKATEAAATQRAVENNASAALENRMIRTYPNLI